MLSFSVILNDNKPGFGGHRARHGSTLNI